MAISFPDPKARPCPNECGVPVTNARTPTGNQTVHTGTWQSKCTPKREDKR